MAVTASDLKFFKSAGTSTSANNTVGIGTPVSSVGGAISATEVVSGSLHDLFDAVTSGEASAGRTEYRCIYVSNANATPQTLYASRIFIQSNTASVDSTLEIGLDVAPVGTNSAITLLDEIDSDNRLAAVAFSSATDFANGLVIGDVPGSGGKKAVWIKRTINPGAAAASETATISWQGDTDA